MERGATTTLCVDDPIPSLNKLSKLSNDDGVWRQKLTTGNQSHSTSFGVACLSGWGMGGGSFGFLFELEFWKGRRAQLVPSGPSLYLIDSFLMHNKPSSMMEGPTCLHTWLLQMHAAC
jgi:hypothetical protein